MNSSSLCSQCLRALRHNICAESRTTSRRNFSSNLQNFKQQSVTRKPSPKSKPLPFIPTTASTVTTNVTAPDPTTSHVEPESSPQNTPSHDSTGDVVSTTSVSQMQKQIMSGLRSDSLTTRLAKGLRKSAKSTTESYIVYGETEAIFKACASQADYTIPEDQRMSILTGKGPPKTADGADLGHAVGKSWWYDTIGLEPTFASWSQVTYLHMYIITLRLRSLETADACRNYQRYLTEHFSHAAEDKMVLLHNMSARSIRNKYLKDLFLQWRGVITAYDEGIIKGDAVLGGAIWRNLFRGDENVDWEKVAQVVAFIRLAIQTFGNQPIHNIVMNSDGPKGLWAQTHS